MMASSNRDVLDAEHIGGHGRRTTSRNKDAYSEHFSKKVPKRKVSSAKRRESWKAASDEDIGEEDRGIRRGTVMSTILSC